jgi:hypothetical protein
MRQIILSATACLLIAATAPAFAQTNNPNASTPSAPNSGAGISGYPGNKNGPPPEKGTVGAAGGGQQNPGVSQQDTSKIQGLPGNKSGPPAKQPSK